MAGIEEVIKMVHQIYRKKHNQADSPCPDEEVLVCFSEGRLLKDESEKIRKHINSCHRCAEIVSLFCQKFEEHEEIPEFLIRKTKSLVKKDFFSDIFEVALALKEKTLQILSTTGDVILDNEIMPLPVLRSRQISDFSEEIKLIKEFKDIKITIHIQKKDKDKIRISLTLLDRNSLQPLSDLRLILLEDGDEVESYEVAAGNAVFDKVSFGRHAIQILRKGNKLGVINLDIK